MASNQEESFSNLEDRNQMGTTCTATAPIYFEGTPSREIMFHLPPLTATRCSSGFLEASRYLSSHENAFGHYEPYRDHTSVGQLPSTKGLKPGTFDGSGNWTDYLIQFNLIADYYSWSNYDRALQLARGTAQGVLSDLSQEQGTNFNSLVSALAARFEPVQQSELYRAKIKSRIRRKGEPIVELAQDIRKLIRLAYPSATTQVREQLSTKTVSLML